MRKSLPFLLLLVSCAGSDEPVETDPAVPPVKDTVLVPAVSNNVPVGNSSSATYTFETFENTAIEGWGYRILMDGELYINQPHIPAVQGNKGFSTEEDAAKTAEFAISKMNMGFVPPTMTVAELDSLGVLNQAIVPASE